MEKMYFVLHLLPSRQDFAQTMNDEEHSIMMKHISYWTEKMNQWKVLAFERFCILTQCMDCVLLWISTNRKSRILLPAILRPA